MAKIDIVLEIESILKQEKPDESRLNQLRVKLLEPKENDRVKAILAKQGDVTTNELKILVNKGLTKRDIAKKLKMDMKDLNRILGTTKAGKHEMTESEARYHAAELNKNMDLYLKHYAEKVEIPEHVLRAYFKKYNLEIEPRQIFSPETLRAIELLNNDVTMPVARACKLTGAKWTSINNQIKKGRIKERVK